jgi:hypothetical protein
MDSIAYYREEGRRCRKFAAADPLSTTAKRWLQLAEEYDQLAESVERSSGYATPMGLATQPQPVQMRHSKTRRDA